MTGREQTEIERKYDVEPASRIPEFEGVDGVAAVSRPEPVTLTAVYYDTADNDLGRRRIVLRRREGGGDAGWHLKMPADEGRTEVHWPLDVGAPDGAAEDVIPTEVLEPVRAIVRDRPLTPLARISTVRSTVLLFDADGGALAEIADDEVSASDVRGGSYRKWREWEAELLDGAPDTRAKRTRLLDAIEQALLAAGARPSSSIAKIARAVGVDSLAQLDTAPTLPGLLPASALQDPDSAAVIVVGALRELTETLIDNDPRARADAPDAIHKMRTVVRRLRSVLGVYARLFEKSAVTELRRELKQLGIELGRARDAEVSGGRMAAELNGVAPHPTDDAEIRLVGGARRDYAEELERVRGYLLSTRYYRLLDTLEAFAAWPPLTAKAGVAAPQEIGRDLTKAAQAMAEATAAVTDAENPEAALHEVRKVARRLRYAAEAVALAEPAAADGPVAAPAGRLSKKAKKAAQKSRKKAKTKRAAAAARFAKSRRRYLEIARLAKPLVKRLGDRHDRLLYIEQLEQAAQAAHEDGENSLVYGLLVARAERLDDTVTVVLSDAQHSLRALQRLVRKL